MANPVCLEGDMVETRNLAVPLLYVMAQTQNMPSLMVARGAWSCVLSNRKRQSFVAIR